MREPRAGLGPLSREASRGSRGARSETGSRPHPSQGGVTVSYQVLGTGCRPRPAAICSHSPLQVAASNYIRDMCSASAQGGDRGYRQCLLTCPLAPFSVPNCDGRFTWSSCLSLSRWAYLSQWSGSTSETDPGGYRTAFGTFPPYSAAHLFKLGAPCDGWKSCWMTSIIPRPRLSWRKGLRFQAFRHGFGMGKSVFSLALWLAAPGRVPTGGVASDGASRSRSALPIAP